MRYYLLIAFILVAISESNLQHKTFYLSNLNKKFSDDVTGNQVICTRPQPKTLKKIFSTVRVEIQSNNSNCMIYEDVNITSINKDKTPFRSMVSSILARFKSFQEESNNMCHHVIFVPLYTTYCLEIDLDGHLEVDYVFTSIDLKLVLCFLIGIAIFQGSRHLSKNEIFHYFSGISLGVLGSTMIIFFILYKLLPKKKIALLTLITTGTSYFAFFSQWLYSSFKSAAQPYQTYIVGYFIAAAIISALYCYYKGPVKNERALNLIELFLKFIGLTLIYLSTSYHEISFALIIGMFIASLVFRYMTRVSNVISPFVNRINYRLFPPRHRFLTADEYTKQASDYTQQELEKLKEYCRSPDCDHWRIISRVKSPDRLAKFVRSETNHISDDESREYENYTINRDLGDDEDSFENDISNL